MNNNNFDEIVEKMKNQKDKNEAQDFLRKSLNPSQTKRLQEIMSDKNALQQLLATPQAQELLKKFTEDKND
ncbi:MAG: hypothetical protein IKU41_04025 [Clostridia bacterium]|nr:hypothetical protein [Clostridia bacterium]